MELILYSRVGCCLCEELERRLRKLPLHNLSPPLKLLIKNIDGKESTDFERNRFGLSVPVLLLAVHKQNLSYELPRASPRLTEEALFTWLQKVVKSKIENF